MDEELEGALRAQAHAAAGARPLDVKRHVEWLEATGVVRDAFTASGRRPPLDPGLVVDATLEGAWSLLPVGADFEGWAEVGRVFAGLSASRLRPSDRLAAQQLVERIGSRCHREAWTEVQAKKEANLAAHDRLLRAAVDLDLDVSVYQLHDPTLRGPQADVIRTRVALTGPGALDDPGSALQAIELEAALGDRLGPVTRARLLAPIPRGEPPPASLARLQRATRLDPESYDVRLVLVHVLRVLGRTEEAVAEARTALDRRDARATEVLPVMRQFGLSRIERSCLVLLREAGAFDDAARVLQELAPGPERDALREELGAARSAAGSRAGGD